ncbi:MAG TPA: FAD-dependent pyridine nucleotide-disulfide oxidoreductase [Deltaproteobacteria bacterium]|nr:FAD-dependent pyridine nucleotide-disulfide oxidoreductase [Deltaproteobacteria bacterium]
MERVIVIGGGPAAISLAKILDGKKHVTIIRPEDHSMIYCAMPYVIENIIPLNKTLKKDSLVTDTGATLIRDRVEKVGFEQKYVHTENGNVYTYDKLVIATGADPVLPPIEGVDLKGVLTFKTEDDLKMIVESAENGLKTAVVVGAGAIGIELAQALNSRGIQTHLVDMEEQVLPNLLDKEMAEEVKNELVRLGITLHLGHKVLLMHGKDFVSEVILDKGDTIHLGTIDDCSEDQENEVPPSLVAFAVGMRPNVGIFEGTMLDIGRDGIVINDAMETNIEDVYAVGDCTQFTSAITGDISPGKLATNAVPMGKLLARNMLGSNERYTGFYNGAATKTGNYYVGGTGLSEKAAWGKIEVIVGYAYLTTAFPIMPSAGSVRIKLIAGKDSLRIVGGQVVSEQPATDKIDLITMAIQSGLTAKDLRMFSYSSQPYQSYFPANNLLVQAAEDILEQSEKETIR